MRGRCSGRSLALLLLLQPACWVSVLVRQARAQQPQGDPCDQVRGGAVLQADQVTTI